MIRDITAKLYSDIPKETLYHYSTFAGLTGIVRSGALWASDIRYMNDSAEMRHTADLIGSEITRRIAGGRSDAGLLNQFQDWVAHRFTNGHMLFASSFRSNGNLLSQWRGYSSLGKGVSIGFDPVHLINCAERQSFQIGRCIYDPDAQNILIGQVVGAVEALAARYDSEQGRRASRSYHSVFENVESDLLRIAAILKHPSFQEEDEWRVVSPVLTDYVGSQVLFREGTSMLVPYVEFSLLCDKYGRIPLEHIFLGPTPNIDLSMNSLAMFLKKKGIEPKNGIDYCSIPFRQR
jgi:hypothetical protein